MEQTIVAAPRYRVQWIDDAGKKKHLDFYMRKSAITFLNTLVLDFGRAAKFRTLPKAKVS